MAAVWFKSGWSWVQTLLLFSVLSHLLIVHASIASPPVVTWLNTPWAAPPLIVEIIEFVAHGNRTAVFPFVSWLLSKKLVGVDETAHATEAEIFKIVLEERGGVVEKDPVTDSLLKLSISLHNHAPAVQAHYQFYTDTVAHQFEDRVEKGEVKKFDSECDVWVDWYGTQFCSWTGFHESLGSPMNREDAASSDFHPRTEGPKPSILSVDHVFQGSAQESSSAPTAVLYADLMSADFETFHVNLMNLANRFGIRYVLRFRPSKNAQSAEPTHLSGYGVELAIKSTEYKVIDDRNLQSGEDTKDEDDDTSHDASDSHSLDSVLDSTTPSVKALTKEELHELGMKVSTFVANSTNPLQTLVKVTQDLPKYAHILATLPQETDPTPL
ncbi:hypothetical protein HK102_002197, partial [Quaeritorhiza haematococci]